MLEMGNGECNGEQKLKQRESELLIGMSRSGDGLPFSMGSLYTSLGKRHLKKMWQIR